MHWLDFQMSCFVVTAWEALAAQEGKTIWEMPVEWKHVEIHQPVRAERTEKVELGVLFDFNHTFQVSHSPVPLDQWRSATLKTIRSMLALCRSDKCNNLAEVKSHTSRNKFCGPDKTKEDT